MGGDRAWECLQLSSGNWGLFLPFPLTELSQEARGLGVTSQCAIFRALPSGRDIVLGVFTQHSGCAAFPGETGADIFTLDKG